MPDSANALTSGPATGEPALADSDYDSILAAVMETARGRWFLHEYVRRNRNADTGSLLAAIDRIESLLKTRADVPAEPPLEAPAATSPAGLPGILVQLRDVAENLIECGAPTYLCNDLLRRIEDLAVAFSQPATTVAPAEAAPVLAISSMEAISGVEGISSVEIVVSEPPRDPFADILALSPEERIALFT
jgi:hypothetical protein